jgi:membrane protein implicated in regulation of membrane protease activity
MTPRLAALFMSAVLGLLVAVGLVLSTLGWVIEIAYVAVVLVALGLLVRRARSLRAPRDDGRSCSCCTTTVFDPVEVR